MKKRRKSTDPKQSSASINFKPIHREQVEALQCIRSNDISFLMGPAGSSKTYLATAFAVEQMLSRDLSMKISRPSVSQGPEMGFLPGSASEKLSPFLEPIFDAIEQLSGGCASEIKSKIQIVPLALIRGRSLRDCTFIIDEAQNIGSINEIRAILTRLGDGARIILCGDCDQSDLGRRSPLEDVAKKLNGISVDGHSVGAYTFSGDAIVRHPLIPEILKALEDD